MCICTYAAHPLLHYINELCGFYATQELVLPRALYAYFVCAMNHTDYFAIVER